MRAQTTPQDETGIPSVAFMAELGPVVGLDTLNGDRECPPELLDKVDGELDRAVVVELQDPESGGRIDGGEPI